MSSKLKKVCFLNPTVIVRRPISELAGLLSSKGHKIGLMTPSQKNHDKKEHHLGHLKNVEVIEFKTRRFIPVEFEWPVPGTDFFGKLKKASKQYDVFHIWTHFYLHTVIAVFYLRYFARKKVILTMDTLPGDSFSSGLFIDLLFRIYNRTLGKWVINSSDVLTLYGNSLKKIVMRTVRPRTRVEVIPTGIYPKDMSKIEKGKIRRELGLLGKSTKIVTFIGLVGKRKGIDIIIEVANKFLREGDGEVVFLIVGDSPKRKYWQRRSPKNMIYLGRRSDVWEILADTDVFFFPSRGEGLPGVVMEAMVAGVPVVASRIPCIDELVDDGKSISLIAKQNPLKYFKIIKSKINSKNISESSSIKKFYWKQIAVKYLEHY